MAGYFGSRINFDVTFVNVHPRAVLLRDSTGDNNQHNARGKRSTRANKMLLHNSLRFAPVVLKLQAQNLLGQQSAGKSKAADNKARNFRLRSTLVFAAPLVVREERYGRVRHT